MNYQPGKKLFFNGHPQLDLSMIRALGEYADGILVDHPVVVVKFDKQSKCYVCVDVAGEEIIAYERELSEERIDALSTRD